MSTFSNSMNLFWNEKTNALSSFLIKPSVFLKMKDLKFFKNEDSIDIDKQWAILLIINDNYGIVI